MAYTAKTDWKLNDTVMPADMNRVEQGIANVDAGKEALVKTAETKTTPVDADGLVLVDSAAQSSTKRVLWSAVKAALKTWLEGLFLPLAGGTMTGDIQMNSHMVMGCASVSAELLGADAVYTYDVYGTENTLTLNTVQSGGNLHLGTAASPCTTHVYGALNCHSQNITNVASPTQTTHAANKAYVDAAAGKSTKVSATLAISSWSSSAPYTQTRTVSGITSAKNAIVGLASTATLVEREAARAAKLSVTAVADNSITVTADGEKPVVAIPLTVIILS